MTALLLLIASAAAWDLAPGSPVVLPEGEIGLALVTLDDVPWLVTGGESSWSLVDPLTGSASLSMEGGAAAAAGLDMDGDASDDVLLCMDDGLWAVFTGHDPVGPLQLDEATCLAVVGLGLDGESVPSAADGAEVRVYSDIPETGGSYAAATGAAPVLVGDGTALSVASAGDWSVHEVLSTGVTTTPAGGKVGDLVAHEGAWAWSLTDEAQVVLGGVVTNVGNRPGPLASADLDGDSAASLVIVYPTHDAVGVLQDDGSERIFAAGAGADGVLVADLDADGCEDLLLLGEIAVVPVLVTGCDGGVDTGDPCADAPLGLSVSGAPEEGRAISLHLDAPPDCYPEDGLRWELLEGGGIADCAVRDELTRMDCDLVDDGPLRVAVRSVDGDDVLGEVEQSLMVANRAPELLYFPTFMNLGEAWADYPLEARDVAADTITWELVDGPPGMVVTLDGHLFYEADGVGWWSLALVLSDEDGGRARFDQWVEVWDDGGDGPGPDDPDDGGEGGCLCCAGSSAAGLLPLVLLLGLPRRRML